MRSKYIHHKSLIAWDIFNMGVAFRKPYRPARRSKYRHLVLIDPTFSSTSLLWLVLLYYHYISEYHFNPDLSCEIHEME